MGFFHNQTLTLPTDSARPTDYSVFDDRVVFRNQTFALVSEDSVRPIDYSVSDNRVVFAPSPTPYSCSSLSHAHRSMGFFHRQTLALAAADSERTRFFLPLIFFVLFFFLPLARISPKLSEIVASGSHTGITLHTLKPLVSEPRPHL